MKVLSWNIRQGGGRRLDAITAAIIAHGADIVIINELRARTAPALAVSLRGCGLLHCESTGPSGHENGILVASRAPMRRLQPCAAAAILPHGLLEVEITGLGTIGAVYGPMLTHTWATFWNELVSHVCARCNDSYLLIGDFNTGEAGVDAYKNPFAGSDQFLAIRAGGFADVWRRHNSGTEPTWFSFGRGGVRLNGFRIDHALASRDLADRTVGCRYSHVEREERLSDHSVLLVEFNALAT